MEIYKTGNYGEMSKQSANDVYKLTQSIRNPLLCTASGDSPAGLYLELIKLINDNQPDISTWNFVGLDEWVGMNGSDEGSCRFYLDKQLFDPLKISKSNIGFFDGRADALKKECDDIENFINDHDGIDVAILGLGMNGHIGMNEPGASPGLFSHVTNLDPITQKTGQKYFKEPKQLNQGITLGLATIMKAKSIFLLVNGTHKAGIVKRILEEEISDGLPGSILRNHADLRIYLDKDAASLIHSI